MKKADEEFVVRGIQEISGLYFPLMSEKGLKSAVTPDLHGDLKTDQNHFLLEPASAVDLTEKNTMRNFFLQVRETEGEEEKQQLFSLTGNSPFDQVRMGTDAALHADAVFSFGCMEVDRRYPYAPVASGILSFVPYDRNEEIHRVTITNTYSGKIRIRLTAVIPLYGRSADNLRDHRHVTSLLNRAKVKENGIFLTPAMSFDERGHRGNTVTTYAVGFDERGGFPETFYPDPDAFCGTGSLAWPQVLFSGGTGEKEKTGYAPGEELSGKEVLGAFSFPEITLEEGERFSYFVKIGIADTVDEAESQAAALDTLEKTEEALAESHAHWAACSPLSVKTGNPDFNLFMKWTAFQPTCRRIFGCSFLPHHDYGKGGRGWRDLWQDCLALLLSDPESLRPALISQFGGVRTDGTNATIIGDNPGEFKSDRNNISRLWCDHAAWPLQTILLYIEESGDTNILFEKAPYFRDAFTHRVSRRAGDAEQHGSRSSTGTVFEHILLEQLTAVYDLGLHGNVCLHNADWNDAMDMAPEKGESVPFTAYYAGNLKALAELIRKCGTESFSLAQEIFLLLTPTRSSRESVPSAAEKRDMLRVYCDAAANGFSGKTLEISAGVLADYLESLAGQMIRNLNRSEFLEKDGLGYFRGYYDNDGNPLERSERKDISLIAQVYPLMFREVPAEKLPLLCSSTKRLLFRQGRGGYALNSDFGPDAPGMKMGRMFGFAYGTKENGAVFSHMAVMYANALFKNGLVEEGWEALQELFRASMAIETSHVLPGIPEYFDLSGRGYYHYLTGAASWYALTLVTEICGVSGEMGNLRIAPCLPAGIFDEKEEAELTFAFRGIPLEITYTFEPGLREETGRNLLEQLSCGEERIEVSCGAGTIPYGLLKKEAEKEGIVHLQAVVRPTEA